MLSKPDGEVSKFGLERQSGNEWRKRRPEIKSWPPSSPSSLHLLLPSPSSSKPAPRSSASCFVSSHISRLLTRIEAAAYEQERSSRGGNEYNTGRRIQTQRDTQHVIKCDEIFSYLRSEKISLHIPSKLMWNHPRKIGVAFKRYEERTKVGLSAMLSVK